MAGTLSDQQDQVPEIERVANPQSVAYSVWAPKTNPALQLAASLSELEPRAGAAAVAYSRNQMQVQGEATKQAALKTKGADFAEAVRTGQIEPTQNPWYIQAYQRNAAQVRTQQSVAQLNTEAATWAEQNDPAAFQQKYMKALSDLGKGYTNPDSQEGFNAAAQPALSDAIAQNQAYNVTRIKGERLQDLSSLTGRALQKATAIRGGATDPAKVIAALAPFKAEYLATGGTVTDWNAKVLPGAITDAAFASKNESIIDIAKKLPNEAGGSIYDQVGIAKEMEQAGYEIDRQKRYDASINMQAMQFKQDQETREIEGLLFQSYGPDVYSGKFDEQAAIRALSGKYPPASIARAFQAIASTSNAVRELAANRTAGFESSPEGSQHLSSLYAEAQMQGWSEKFETDIGNLILRSDISEQTAEDLRAKALSTTRSKATAGGGTQMQALTRRQNIIKQWTEARDVSSKAADNAETIYRQFGGTYLTPEQHDDLNRAVVDAVGDFLEANPKGFKLVRDQAALAAQNWVRTHSSKPSETIQVTPK